MFCKLYWLFNFQFFFKSLFLFKCLHYLIMFWSKMSRKIFPNYFDEWRAIGIYYLLMNCCSYFFLLLWVYYFNLWFNCYFFLEFNINFFKNFFITIFSCKIFHILWFICLAYYEFSISIQFTKYFHQILVDTNWWEFFFLIIKIFSYFQDNL